MDRTAGYQYSEYFKMKDCGKEDESDMTEKQAYETLRFILKELDTEKYPECVKIIQYSIDDDDDNIYCIPFDIACDLHNSDQAEVMPKCVADFVIAVYLDEIERGNAEAMTNLGSLYYTGRCGEQSYEKAIKYYTMADGHGERQATENLGYCYYYGRSVPVDYKKAFHYFVSSSASAVI